MPPALSKPLIANPKVILQEGFDDYVVLFHPETTQSFGLNPIGLAIWKMLARERSTAEIVSALRDQCSDAPLNIDNDVTAFLTALLNTGFAGYADGGQ